MKVNNYPALSSRLFSVWYRHVLVYSRNLLSNGLPPFLEPLIFLAGIGLGLGKYITSMEGMPYIQFLASGLLVTSAMYTAAFECTFGTFIRLEYEYVYDGMIAAPLSVKDLILGEILYAGTKGFFFSFAVWVIIAVFGILPITPSIFSPIIGFITGLMFAAISMVVTSFVKSINHFNFYMTGVLSPMFFFSGVVFPIGNLPRLLQPFAELMPLTHCVFLVRAICLGEYQSRLWIDLFYCLLVIVIVTMIAIQRLKKRMIH